MSRSNRRLLIWIVIACFAVFFGVDLATKGIEEIHGPLPSAPVHSEAKPQKEADPEYSRLLEQIAYLEAQLKERDSQILSEQPEPTSGSVPTPYPQELMLSSSAYGDTLVNRVADSTGLIVRGTAQKSVELLISLFDGILD